MATDGNIDPELLKDMPRCSWKAKSVDKFDAPFLEPELFRNEKLLARFSLDVQSVAGKVQEFDKKIVTQSASAPGIMGSWGKLGDTPDIIKDCIGFPVLGGVGSECYITLLRSNHLRHSPEAIPLCGFRSVFHMLRGTAKIQLVDVNLFLKLNLKFSSILPHLNTKPGIAMMREHSHIFFLEQGDMRVSCLFLGRALCKHTNVLYISFLRRVQTLAFQADRRIFQMSVCLSEMFHPFDAYRMRQHAKQKTPADLFVVTPTFLNCRIRFLI